MIIKYKSFSRWNIIAVLIAFLPITRYYRFPWLSYSFGTISLWLLFAICTPCLTRKIPKRNRKLFYYTAYIILGYFISIFLYNAGSYGTRLYNVLIQVLIVILACGNKSFRGDILLKTIENISIVASLLLFIQYAIYYSSGRFLQLIPLHFFTDSIQNNFSSFTRITTGTASGYFRPSSFFIEPAHFGQFVLVALAFVLFKYYKNSEKQFIIKAIVLSLAILMSTSGIGLFGVVVLWTIFMFVFSRKINNRKVFGIFLFILFALVIAVVFLSKQEFVQLVFMRLSVDSSSNMNAVSGRTEGYDFFFGDAFNNKLFGIGTGNEPMVDVYYTSLAMLLIRNGFLGVILYFIICCHRVLQNGRFAKWIAIVILLIVASAGVYDFANVAFYLTLMFMDVTFLDVENDMMI